MYAPSSVRNKILGRSSKPIKKNLSLLLDKRQISLRRAIIEPRVKLFSVLPEPWVERRHVENSVLSAAEVFALHPQLVWPFHTFPRETKTSAEYKTYHRPIGID